MENQEANKPEKEYTPQQDLLLYIRDLIYLFAVIIVVFILCFRMVIVSGGSMNRTLFSGDALLLLSNTFYQDPKQGDIVVVSKESFENGRPIVKRVIATEGQEVNIDFSTGIVYVDGVALEEPYVNTPTNTNGGMEFPLVVEEGCIFAMGDNRNSSRDSRYPEIGQIDTREILGKAIFLIFPGDPDGADGPEKRDLGRIGVVS